MVKGTGASDPDGSDTAGNVATVGSVGTCTNAAPTTASPHVGGPAPYWQSYTYDPLGDRTQEVRHDTTANSTANTVTQNTAYPGGGTTAAALPNVATATTTTGPGGSFTSTPGYDAAGNTNSRTTTSTGTLVSGLTRSGTKLCADDTAASTTDANPIDIYTCNNTNAQNWTFSTDGTVSVLGRCLHAVASGTAAGTKVVLYHCTTTSAGEIWYPTSNGSLYNPHSAKCLDSPGASTTNGTQLVLSACTGAAEQRWTHVNTGTLPPGSVQHLTYDAEGRTATATTPASGTGSTSTKSTSYLYDADGGLLLQTTPTSKILYLFGGAEQLTLDTAASTVTGLRYYPGPDGITEVRSSTTAGTARWPTRSPRPRARRPPRSTRRRWPSPAASSTPTATPAARSPPPGPTTTVTWGSRPTPRPASTSSAPATTTPSRAASSAPTPSWRPATRTRWAATRTPRTTRRAARTRPACSTTPTTVARWATPRAPAKLLIMRPGAG